MRKKVLLAFFATIIAITVNAQWQTVGMAGFSAGAAGHTSLAFNSNDVPYVAYYDETNIGKATVMKFNGTDWETVGSAGFSGQAEYPSLAVNSNDEPYVAYKDKAFLFTSPATVMKFVDATSGINDLNTEKNAIAVYPNPTKNQINFSVLTNVQLTNMTGQIITEKKNVNTLDLSYQPSGIYFLTLTNNNGQVVQRNKIVKE